MFTLCDRDVKALHSHLEILEASGQLAYPLENVLHEVRGYVNAKATLDFDFMENIYTVTNSEGVVFVKDSSEKTARETAESEGYSVSWREKV